MPFYSERSIAQNDEAFHRNSVYPLLLKNYVHKYIRPAPFAFSAHYNSEHGVYLSVWTLLRPILIYLVHFFFDFLYLFEEGFSGRFVQQYPGLKFRNMVKCMEFFNHLVEVLS